MGPLGLNRLEAPEIRGDRMRGADHLGGFSPVLLEQIPKRLFQEIIQGALKVNGQFLGKLEEIRIYTGRKHLFSHAPQDTKK